MPSLTKAEELERIANWTRDPFSHELYRVLLFAAKERARKGFFDFGFAHLWFHRHRFSDEFRKRFKDDFRKFVVSPIVKNYLKQDGFKLSSRGIEWRPKLVADFTSEEFLRCRV